MTSSNCLGQRVLPEHEEAGGHALAAGNGVLLLGGGAHELEEALRDPEVLAVAGLLASYGVHDAWN